LNKNIITTDDEGKKDELKYLLDDEILFLVMKMEAG
jgi:hypothetical protein